MSQELPFLNKLISVSGKAKITRIILVDDDFEEVEDVKARSSVLAQILQAYKTGDNRQLDQLKRHNLIDDFEKYDSYDEVREEVIEKWGAFSSEKKQEICNDLVPNSKGELAGDIVDLLGSSLSETPIKVSSFGVNGWSRFFNEIKNNPLDNDEKVLVLFDEELSNAGSTVVRGRDLIEAVLKSNVSDCIIPGLLTQEVNTEAEEIYLANELFSEGIIAGVLGKYRKNDIDSFCKGIISYFLINYLWTVKTIVFESYLNTNVLGENRDCNIKHNILLDFLRMATSEGEPVYKEVLHYVADYHLLLIENEIRNKCIVSDKAVLLEELERAEVSGVNLIDDSHEESKMYIDETLAYIKGELLSMTHHPLEIGDIFCIMNDATPEYYGLLNQPCSIALRGDGKRKQDTITLVKLEYSKPPDGSIIAGSVSTGLPKFSKFDSAFFINDKKEPYIHFDFASYLSVPSTILDLCAFSDEGRAETAVLKMNGGLLESSMRKRKEFLIQWFQGVVSKHDEIKGALGDLECRDEMLNLALRNECCINSQKLNVVIDESCLSFNITRIGRLKERYSHGILIEYARYLSRPAYPISLSED